MQLMTMPILTCSPSGLTLTMFHITYQCESKEFSEIHIYEHYLNVVRKIINIKLTVLHTLMLRTAFSIIQVISTGSCMETPFPDPNPRQLQCSSRTRAHNEMSFGQLKGKISGSEKPEGCTVHLTGPVTLHVPYYTTLPTSEKEKKSLIKPKIKDKTNLLNSICLEFYFNSSL